jgi:outer membrane protein assembly factor BamB
MVETQKFPGDPKRPPGSEGALQVGSVLQSRYRITGVLGVGGMGSVYLARDMHFPTVQRNVAVKEMLNLASDPNLRELTLRNFEREANILADLSHPAIPKIYDYFSSRDRAYLVMEYISGRDLEAMVNTVPDFVPFEMVRRWALELCDVLSYLHAHEPEPIIFRDMKPSNVMIDSQGIVRLIDFGIAKTFQPDQKGTQIGTEGYAPPEQYRGEATPSGDVYALGATLHHVLTRQDPRMEAPFSFQERPIRQTNPSVPEAFAAIIMKALAYNATERFPSAQAMKEAIEALEQSRAVPAVDGGLKTQMIPGEGVDVDAFERFAMVKPLWKFRCEDEIRASPVYHKGRVFVAAYDNNLYCLDAADGSFKWKFATEGGLPGTPAISADEDLIIFGSEDRSLYAVETRTGKIAWSFQSGGPIRSSVNVAHGHVFFGSDDAKLYAVRLTNGRLAWKFDASAAIRSRPALTDERIVVGMENGELVGLDLSGALKWRFKAKRAIISSPIIHDQIAYMGSMDWHVYAVDVQSGWAVWRYRTSNAVIASPLIVGRTLYIGSADGYMYALDLGASGREVWKFQTEGQVVSTPVFHNGAIYFGGVDQHVYSVDVKKGQLRWKFETDGPISGSACIVDNVLYIGSTDHCVYALSV